MKICFLILGCIVVILYNTAADFIRQKLLLKFLLHVQEVPGSDLGLETGYILTEAFAWFPSFP